MKSAAIVLGLALAANAQVDNELATSLPYHPSGADLVRNAGWGRHLPIHTPPKHTNPIYWSKNDDAADDELVQTFYSPSGADLVKYAKQSQQTVYRPTAHVVRDDATDDELMVRLLPRESFQTEEEYQKYLAKMRFHRDDEELFVAPEGRLGEIAKKYPGKIMFDEADDELMVYYTKDSQGNKHYQGGYTVRRDDATDDELMVYYTKDSQGNKHYQGGYTVRRDDATDDELMVYYTKDSQGNKHYQGGYTVRRDDAADDELVQTFYSPSGADLVKYAKQSQQTVYRPTAHVVRDDATDDELMVYYTKDSQGNKHYEGGYTVRRDDEADDELAYLGHLIRETQPEKIEKKIYQMPEVRRHFRHVEKN